MVFELNQKSHPPSSVGLIIMQDFEMAEVFICLECNSFFDKKQYHCIHMA